jgi:hypothetical protein
VFLPFRNEIHAWFLFSEKIVVISEMIFFYIYFYGFIILDGAPTVDTVGLNNYRVIVIFQRRGSFFLHALSNQTCIMLLHRIPICKALIEVDF